MRKRTLKGAAMAAMTGMLFQIGGCLSLDGFWGRTLMDGAVYVGFEWLLDNDGVTDLFEDGAVAE